MQILNSSSVWKCLKCGKCCKLFVTSGVSVSKKEIIQIGKKIKKLKMNPNIIKETKSTYTLPVTNSDIPRTCIFLKNNLCVIYLVRPTACKQYPIEIIESKDKVKIYVSYDCPRGVGIAKELRKRLPFWLHKLIKGRKIEVVLISFYEEKIKSLLREE